LQIPAPGPPLAAKGNHFLGAEGAKGGARRHSAEINSPIDESTRQDHSLQSAEIPLFIAQKAVYWNSQASFGGPTARLVAVASQEKRQYHMVTPPPPPSADCRFPGGQSSIKGLASNVRSAVPVGSGPRLGVDRLDLDSPLPLPIRRRQPLQRHSLAAGGAGGPRRLDENEGLRLTRNAVLKSVALAAQEID